MTTLIVLAFTGWRGAGKDTLYAELADKSLGFRDTPDHAARWLVYGRPGSAVSRDAVDSLRATDRVFSRHPLVDSLWRACYRHVLGLEEAWTPQDEERRARALVNRAWMTAVSLLVLPTVATMCILYVLLWAVVVGDYTSLVVFLVFVLVVVLFLYRLDESSIDMIREAAHRLTVYRRGADGSPGFDKDELYVFRPSGYMFDDTEGNHGLVPIQWNVGALGKQQRLGPAYQSARKFVAELGSAVRRVDPLHWVEHCAASIAWQKRAAWPRVAVVPDVRFPEELAGLKTLLAQGREPPVRFSSLRLYRAEAPEPPDDVEHALDHHACDLLLVPSTDDFDRCCIQFSQYGSYELMGCLMKIV